MTTRAARRGKTGRKATRADATVRKARALPLLLQGLPYAEIAEAIGVKPRTIEDWVAHDTTIKRALADLAKDHEQVIEDARKELRGGVAAAIRTLIEKAEAGSERAASRLLDLLGVGMPRKHEHEHELGPVMSAAQERMLRRFAEERAAARAAAAGGETKEDET